MGRGHHRYTRRVSAALALLGLAAPHALAQDTAPGGLTIGATYGIQARTDDGEEVLRNTFGLSIDSRTRTQVFELDLSAALDLGADDDGGSALDDQNARLRYSIENRANILTFDARFSQSDIQTTALELNEFGDTELVTDDGDRRRTNIGLLYEFGRERPFGGSLQFGYRAVDHVNTTAATLIDTDTTSADLDLRFDVNPQVIATLAYSFEETDREGGTTITRNELALGARFNLSQRTEGTLSLGVSEVENVTTTSRVKNDGFTIEAGLSHTRPNGTISGSLRSSLNENGRRTDASIARSFTLPNGALSGSVGVTRDDDGDTFGIASFNYDQTLARGAFGVSLSRAASVSNGGDDVLNTRLNVRYQQSLTALSSLSVTLGLGTSDFTSGTREDVDQVSFNVSYNHTLTERWSLVSGYTFSRSENTSGTENTDNIFFLGLQTGIEWRP